ncbi:MAG: hypothetical protein K6C08_04255 [Oscillospiraceae bacterium]|nr:hypothetical protein [Oscillospiraceae bacterium]
MKNKKRVPWFLLLLLLTAGVTAVWQIHVRNEARREAEARLQRAEASFQSAMRYYLAEDYWPAVSRFSNAAKEDIPEAEAYYLLSFAHYYYETEDDYRCLEKLEELLQSDCSDAIRAEAEELKALSESRQTAAREAYRLQQQETEAARQRYLREQAKKASAGRRSSSAVRASDPYHASDYAHPEDFYDWYYDDFYDYEEAEEYWEAHAG